MDPENQIQIIGLEQLSKKDCLRNEAVFFENASPD